MNEELFYFIMIRPTHYDDEGYPIRWLKSTMSSGAMAAINGLAEDCNNRNVLGEHVTLKCIMIDETNSYVDVKSLKEQISADNAKALVGMVGVQSNQFPRAVDLSKRFLKEGIPVCIGGFHVSGCMKMLEGMPYGLQEALDAGISLFAGEAEEGRLDRVLQDAYSGALQPIYNHLNDIPSLENAAVPFLPKKHFEGFNASSSTLDLGRGCPFDCSFCTIINVQGKKSRFRSVSDLEKILRKNAQAGIKKFFITDDNFARNRNWEVFLDKIIELGETEGLKIKMTLQVDTQCHKIPRFVEKCARAGVSGIFMGLESINSSNLKAIKKNQNKINDYKAMVLAWKKEKVNVIAAYIVGLPNDTKESILKDIGIIQKELPIDLIYFTMLTPLPGSEDHKKMFLAKEWMDDDMNKYDLYHRVIHHPLMSDSEFEEVYKLCWKTYYSYEHFERMAKRRIALNHTRGNNIAVFIGYMKSYDFYKVHPTDTGLLRIKNRKERRETLPLENRFTFYLKYGYETVTSFLIFGIIYLHLHRIVQKIKKDPERYDYRDSSLTLEES